MAIHKARAYQTDLIHRTEHAWQSGHKFNLIVIATGAGKSYTGASLVERGDVPTACLAHRNELVGQMSLALGREGVRHSVVGAKTLAPEIIRQHMDEFGRSFYDANSPYSVCSVQTLSRLPDSDPVWKRWRRWLSDEAHHFVRANAFGKVLSRFHPDCTGLGLTATPCRADGLGLGAEADGVFNQMIEGPGMRWLIDNGYLTDYQPYCAQSDFNRAAIRIGASGELNVAEAKKARNESHITGDAVKHYLKLASGKLNVVFDTDVAAATATAAAFRAAGVPAEILVGNMDSGVRAHTLRRFKAREILVLVTVDLVSEGFDLPAIECVQFLSATESFSKFAQQFGRALRLMLDAALIPMWEFFPPQRRLELIAASRKPVAIIIDHVGNIVRHGLPDAPREWTLDGTGAAAKGVDPDAIPLRACASCEKPYERFHVVCPYCKAEPEVTNRSGPKFVDGDLVLLSPEILAELRGEKEKVDGAVHLPFGSSGIVGMSIAKNHRLRQEGQKGLRSEMAIWMGWQAHQGRNARQAQKLFYLVYGIDYLSAQSLSVAEAAALQARIEADLSHSNVIAQAA